MNLKVFSLFFLIGFVDCDKNKSDSGFFARLIPSIIPKRILGKYIIKPLSPIVNGVVQFLESEKNNFEENVKLHLQLSRHEDDEKSRITTLRRTEGKIFLLVHGYWSSRNNTWYEELSEVLLNKYTDGLVVQVDWGKFSANVLYTVPAKHTEVIGKKLASLIKAAVDDFYTSTEEIVMIGHSLGAHICGSTGREFFRLTGQKLPRIIALDPAQPYFTNIPKERRLNENDADAVIVVHTDPSLGFKEPCGTLDFFPNGGNIQPGCYEMAITDFLFCSHTRAYEYLMEALKRPEHFMASRCRTLADCKKGVHESLAQLSLGDIETNQTGLFYLNTTASPPYYL